MKIFLVLLIFLSGCSTIGLVPKFPDVPETLTEPCSELIIVKDNSQMSDLLKTVTENYSNYHECREKVNSWNDWYKQQKQLQGTLN